MTKDHSFAYEGKCTGCKQELAGCRFCRSSSYRGEGCSCAVEPIHVTRSMRWRLATARPRKAPAPALEQPAVRRTEETTPAASATADAVLP
jgi:hypothetical protein